MVRGMYSHCYRIVVFPRWSSMSPKSKSCSVWGMQLICWMSPLATCCHTHYCLHHFSLCYSSSNISLLRKCISTQRYMKSLSFYVSFNAGQKLTLLAYAGPTKLQRYHITQFFKSYYLVSSHSIWCARHSLFKCLSDVVQKEIFVLLSALVKAVFHEPLHSHGVLILCNELCTI